MKTRTEVGASVAKLCAGYDWKSMHTAHGDASSVPQLLIDAAEGTPALRRHAWHELWGSVWHQGDRYSASPATLEVLTGALALEVRDVVRCIALAVDLLVGEPNDFTVTGFHPSLTTMPPPQFCVELIRLAGDERAWVRRAAHYGLAWCGSAALDVAGDAFRRDPDPWVRSSAIQSLAMTDPQRALQLARDVDSPMCHLIRALHDEDDDDARAATIVLAAGPSRMGPHGFLWADGDLADFAQHVADHLGLSFEESSAPDAEEDDELRTATQYDAMLAADPRDVTALVGRGFLAHEEEDTSSALQWFERALDVDPEHEEALVMRAWMLSELDRDRDFIEAATKGSTLFEVDHDLAHDLAISLYKIGWFREAGAEATFAAEDPDTYVGAHWLLANIAARHADVAGGAHHIAAVLQADPACADDLLADDDLATLLAEPAIAKLFERGPS